MIVLKCTQDKVLDALQSISGIVERRHILADVLIRNAGKTTITNGMPESGGGGASAEADGAAEAGGAGTDVAASDDDDGGDADSDPDRSKPPRKPQSNSRIPPAAFALAPLSGYIGFGRSRIYQLIADPDLKFPPPLKIGKSSRWLKSEVDAWLKRQADTRTNSSFAG